MFKVRGRMFHKDKGPRAVLRNIEAARAYSRSSDSLNLVAVVSGNESDRDAWSARLGSVGDKLFNADGSTLILSLQEKIGEKTREGNFLGTLLAYTYIREEAGKVLLRYRDGVTLIGMLYGRGERLSPISQAKGCRKPATEVSPSGFEAKGRCFSMTAIEEALLYFTPVAKCLERRGFRGILNKWGDETEVASLDLVKAAQKKESLEDHDVIKFISVIPINDELARQKDWVVFDGSGNMVEQISRDERGEIEKKIKEVGADPCFSSDLCSGISLGPVAVSYDLMDIAEEIFKEDISKEGVYLDFDPYFFMALVMSGEEKERWEEKSRKDPSLKELVSMVPDFFDKVQEIKKRFEKKYGRALNVKVFDLGSDIYWADIGQHIAMREKFLSLLEDSARGGISRMLSGIDGKKDHDGNIIVSSKIAPGVNIKDSVIVNSRIDGPGSVCGSVILDSELAGVEITGAFAVRSVRYGKSRMKKDSGMFESLGTGDIEVEEGMRHVTLLTPLGAKDMSVSERTDIKYKDNYNKLLFGNELSFEDAYDLMSGTSMEELERRRQDMLSEMDRIRDRSGRFRPLKFGTSGLRAKVEEMTDMECYINTMGFISFLKARGEIGAGEAKIALSGDRRSSTPRIMSSVARAIKDSGCKTVFCGRVPSPTLAYFALQRDIPSIMVTGSHIPDDRNGIKFSKRSGEVLKTDEKDILASVAKERTIVYAGTDEEAIFGDDGMFKDSGPVSMDDDPFSREEEAEEEYLRRYLDLFPEDVLQGKTVVLYQHSAVGRDILKHVIEGLGAEVKAVGRSEKFMPVDTEKVSDRTLELLREWAEEYEPFAIVSLDGDSDRPLLADEEGNFLPGDKLGAIVSLYLKPDFAAVPISANDSVLKVMDAADIEVKQTKIGSPYVISAMNDKLSEAPEAKVVSWESNGGYLLGSEFSVNGHDLRALPTRDAVLPLLTVLVTAAEGGKKVSELIETTLPPRVTKADVVDDKTPGCERYTAGTGKAIISMLSPGKGIEQADFMDRDIRIDGVPADDTLKRELKGIRDRIKGYFTDKLGFGTVVSVNFLDGIRICFTGNDVAHIRPSGNAPEFRMYVTSDTMERADEILSKKNEIVARMVNDVLKTGRSRSVGALAEGEFRKKNTSGIRLEETAASGTPFAIRPYREPKVWGRDGIGEYWYGAESGAKSSIMTAGGKEAAMDEVMASESESILGDKVIEKFGRRLPLVKILTPKKRLSVQFHDLKNELWIVTGIDPGVSGTEPVIVLGFSSEAASKYGEDLIKEYKSALEIFAASFNALVDLMEEKGYRSLMEEEGDTLEGARRVPVEETDIAGLISGLEEKIKVLDSFYGYKRVKIGDVIPVPAGTLHALGAGIEVIEPQLPGPTQSLEDGTTYPVRYCFPGYEREGAQKTLDLDRLSELRAEPFTDISPEILREDDLVKVECLPGGFEEKGMEVHRVTLKKGAEIHLDGIESFHTLVLMEGKAEIRVGGTNIDIPEAVPGGEMVIVPASAKGFKIVAEEDTSLVDTFTPTGQ